MAARAAASAQVFVEDLDSPAPEPDDRHHLARVLRLRPGEAVVAADGRGRWRLCEFLGAETPGGSGPRRMLEPSGPVHAEADDTPAMTVAFAPAKGDRPEWVVQKLTELGMNRIVVLSTKRSVVRWQGDRAERALERLRRIAVEAAGQCRRVWLPELVGPIELAQLSQSVHPANLAIAERGGEPLGDGCHAVAVGPEGGWAPEERALGLPAVGLGPYVLRAETAAIVAAAALALLRDATVSTRRPVPGPRGFHDRPEVLGEVRAGRSRR
jgi:16S rRNA (uracil1498-N3)-methyltransferase